MQLTLRPMTESDLDWVVANELELHTSPWTRGNFTDALDAGYASRVLSEDDRPVGYAVVLLVLDEAHLLNLSVVRSRQGAGLGRHFLSQLADESRGLGARQFFLEVRPSNEAAQALYRGFGFQAIGRRKRYYPAPNGGREDAIVMRLDL